MPGGCRERERTGGANSTSGGGGCLSSAVCGGDSKNSRLFVDMMSSVPVKT